VVAPSEYVARALRRSDRRTEADMTVIPHGIDIERFTSLRDARADARAEFDLKNSTVLGAVGRVSPVKNYPVLLRAFARVASADPTLVLVIVGQGKHDELATLSRSLGISDR